MGGRRRVIESHRTLETWEDFVSALADHVQVHGEEIDPGTYFMRGGLQDGRTLSVIVMPPGDSDAEISISIR